MPNISDGFSHCIADPALYRAAYFGACRGCARGASKALDPEGPYRDRPWYCTFGAHGITRACAYGSGDWHYGLCRNACEPHGLECGGSGGAVSRERLPGHYRLWRRISHGLRQGCGGAHCAAKQAHQQDARPVACPPSPAAAYCGSHYRRYGKRSHARGGCHR